MKGTALLLTPQSEHKTGRLRAAQEVLERRGWEVHRLGEDLPKKKRYCVLFSKTAVRRHIQVADRVVILPRSDGSIGAGTLRDLELAEALATPVFVVGEDGEQLPLREVTLHRTADDIKNAARLT